MLYIIIWKSSTPWHLTLLSIIAWPDNPAVPSSKHLQKKLHNYSNNQFINFITDTLPRRTYWVKISLKFPSIRTGFGIFSNTSLCFMSFSRIFHLYPVDNEAEVGESQSSQRQKADLPQAEHVFSNVYCRARLEPIAGRDLMLKSQRPYSLGQGDPLSLVESPPDSSVLARISEH